MAQAGVSQYKINYVMGNSPDVCRRRYAALVPAAIEVEVYVLQRAKHRVSLVSVRAKVSTWKEINHA